LGVENKTGRKGTYFLKSFGMDDRWNDFVLTLALIFFPLPLERILPITVSDCSFVHPVNPVA